MNDNLPQDPKAREILEQGKKIVLILEKNESLHTGEFRKHLEDFRREVKWAEDNGRA